jgi:hypothetical protein
MGVYHVPDTEIISLLLCRLIDLPGYPITNNAGLGLTRLVYWAKLLPLCWIGGLMCPSEMFLKLVLTTKCPFALYVGTFVYVWRYVGCSEMSHQGRFAWESTRIRATFPVTSSFLKPPICQSYHPVRNRSEQTEDHGLCFGTDIPRLGPLMANLSKFAIRNIMSVKRQIYRVLRNWRR